MIRQLDLTSARLRIRHFAMRDLEDCIAFRREVFAMEESQDSAESWLRWTIDSYRELANLSQPPYADYALELVESGAFLGSVGIVPTLLPWGVLNGDAADQRLSPEVGLFWGIMPLYRRRGYASEAGQALLNFLFGRLNLRRVVATTERGNIASQRTMRRLGMRLQANPQKEPAWLQIVGKIENPR